MFFYLHETFYFYNSFTLGLWIFLFFTILLLLINWSMNKELLARFVVTHWNNKLYWESLILIWYAKSYFLYFFFFENPMTILLNTIEHFKYMYVSILVNCIIILSQKSFSVRYFCPRTKVSNSLKNELFLNWEIIVYSYWRIFFNNWRHAQLLIKLSNNLHINICVRYCKTCSLYLYSHPVELLTFMTKK